MQNFCLFVCLFEDDTFFLDINSQEKVPGLIHLCATSTWHIGDGQ